MRAKCEDYVVEEAYILMYRSGGIKLHFYLISERCYCTAYPGIPEKTYSVTIYPNPSKGLFYIEIEDYKGPVITKISDASGKLLETHYLMYYLVISWRLGEGIWELSFQIQDSNIIQIILLIQ